MTARAFFTESGWLHEQGIRLDAGAYAVGGVEAATRIKSRADGYMPLGSVANVSLPHRFARRYVNDRANGTPFLSSSDVLLGDLSGVALISTRATRDIQDLTVPIGATLVSRSGTIGRTAYLRREMVGMAVSEDVLRVVPGEELPWPGFLFAFLTSMQAQAMIIQKTFGSVVQHIEQDHLADLPLPIPSDQFGCHIDDLVNFAANARTEAAELLRDAAAWFDAQTPHRRYGRQHARALAIVGRSSLRRRLDAFHHIGWAGEAADIDGGALGGLADVFSISSMPRIWAERGVPFVTGSNIFSVRPEPERRLATWAARQVGAFVQTGDLLVQAYGQLYGLIGRAAYVGRRVNGWAASHLLFRVRAESPDTQAALFAFFLSDMGRRQVVGHASGNQIPHLVPNALRSVRVPELPADLVARSRRALDLREQADASEQQAIEEVEQWLAS